MASAILSTLIERDAIAMSCGRMDLASQSSSHAHSTVRMFFCPFSLALSCNIASIPGEKSRAVTERTFFAIGKASVPGPDPTSSTVMSASRGRCDISRSIYGDVLFRDANDEDFLSHSAGPLLAQPFRFLAFCQSLIQSISECVIWLKSVIKVTEK